MLGSRFFHISWLILLCVSGIQLTQTLSAHDKGTGHLPQIRAIETTASHRGGMTSVDDAIKSPAIAMGESSQMLTHWSDSIPDQGRPIGRRRGGSSR